MDREGFLSSILAVIGATATPTPKPTPAPSSTLAPWDQCIESTALSYDRPIDIVMQTLDGPDFHLLKYRGQAVLLNIFATWCGPCKLEQPLIVDAADRYSAQGLAVIGINDRDPDDHVRAYRKKYGITYPIAMDRQGGFTRALELGHGAQRDASAYLPSKLFITPQGYLYCYLVGTVSRDELDYRVKKFLVEAPPTLTPSPSPTPTGSV
ncbi:MAG: TlpA disulfide reductase family protein [Candidatus Aquilonibacter sp.]